MPDIHNFSDATRRFATSSAVALGVVLLLLLVLWLLLPKASRSKLRLPAIFWVLYLLTLPPRLWLDPNHTPARILSGVGIFLVLTAVARCTFLLIVDVIIQGRLGKKLPRIIHDIFQGLIYFSVVLITLPALGVEPGSLLTFSALVTAVLGFA